MDELFLDRSKTHIIKDKDKTLEIMFDAGMHSWYVKIKYNKSTINFYSLYFPNELELCKSMPIIKDYMKKEKFNEEMKDIINDTN